MCIQCTLTGVFTHFSLIIVYKWTYSFAAMTENTLEANTIYSQLNRTKLQAELRLNQIINSQKFV